MVSSNVQVLGTSYSPYVNRAQIALNLKSVDFEFIDFEFIEENLSSKSDLLVKSNPVHKKVPVLIHGDKCICESLVIVQYIDEAWTSNGYNILPLDAYDRAVARFWASYVDDKVVPLLRELRSATGDEKVAVKERIEEAMVLLEDAFVKCSKGKDYFGGDNIGYIDIVVGSCIKWLKALEITSGLKLVDEAKIPGLFGWMDKFLSHEAVKNVVPKTEVFVDLLRRMQARAKAAAASN